MGVTGLWNLIEPVGKPVPVDTLENKILAIDISIWLHQVVKGFQDSRGSALANAHLLGLFHRLCKLLYYRIKPVFVFDGGVPQLKRETIAKRNQSRNKLLTEADRIQNLLLQSLAKEKVVQQALGPNVELLISPTKGKQTAQKPDKDDMFKLPDLPPIKEIGEDESLSESFTSTSASEVDSSFDENPRNYYDYNLQAIDVTSSYFKNLPADVRHELLTDIKETRKQSSWGRLHELPSKGDDFSTFQMKRLLKRRQVQVSLEEAEKEMGGRTPTLSELRDMFTEDGIVEPSALEGSTKQIASSEHTRYLLVKNLKKTLEAEQKKVEEEAVKEPQPGTSKHVEDKKAQVLEKNDENVLGEEYDADLEMAIKMSLNAEPTVYHEDDYECDRAKLNGEQRKQLKNSAQGLAKAYMIEYAGFNEDDIKDLLEATKKNVEESDLDFSFKHTDPSILKDLAKFPVEAAREEVKKEEKSDEKSVAYITSDTDSDSDFVEVAGVEHKAFESKSQELKDTPKGNSLEIVINTVDKAQPDDLFADVFAEENVDDDSVTKKEEDKLENKKQEEPKIVRDSSEVQGETSCSKDLLDIKPIPKTNQTDISKILDDLKKEAQSVLKLTLDDIKVDSSIIEISDTDEAESNQPKTDDVIEIPDNDEQRTEADLAHTPSKKKIKDYFACNYVIQRTPEKLKAEDEEAVPKVKSPFFIKKTPKSSGKKRSATKLTPDDSPSGSPKMGKKVSKMLFDKPQEDSSQKDVETLPEINPIEQAAAVLKENKTREELEGLATNIAREKIDLEKERNRQDRMGASITEKMNLDCMHLLRLFGIPYIVAPMEAEAQCAFLDAMHLTDGTITDDSDIWLFGGRTVYKNFFAQNKHVMEFKLENIERSFNIDRKKLIQLAILVGSDYTTGVHGIGAVTALEILAAFPSTERDDETSQKVSTVTSLRKFREWWQNSRNSTLGNSSAKISLRKKLKNIDLHEGFPNSAIVDAYLSPTVDDSREAFTWGSPDVETIREFAKKFLGWTRTKTDEILNPVLKRLSEKKHQANIKNYFQVKSALALNEMRVSKRVQRAIHKMAPDYKSDPEETEPKAKKTKARNQKKPQREPSDSAINTTDGPRKRGKRKPSSTAACTSVDVPNQIEIGQPEPSSASGPKIPKRTVNIPNTNPPIPQREKDLAEMALKKAKAAEVLKSSKAKKNAKS